jgi:hypothetical protein
MAWQATQVLWFRKISRPSATRGSWEPAGAAGGWVPVVLDVGLFRLPRPAGRFREGGTGRGRQRSTQSSKPSSVSTMTRMAMKAWDSPQNSAHCPM